MSYATAQDMVDRFGERELVELTDRSAGVAETVDDAVLTRALDDSTAEIDAYVGAHHRLPLATKPPLLVRIECDIARWRLANDGDTATEEVTERYKAAVALLKLIATGQAGLGLAEPDAPVAMDLPQTTGPIRPLSHKALESF